MPSLKGQIQLTDFNDPQLLTQISGTYFMAQNPTLHTQKTTATLRSGYLEGSNASSLTEMTNLLSAMRGFEANPHIIQIQDEQHGADDQRSRNPLLT